jgi:hypothetical protein
LHAGASRCWGILGSVSFSSGACWRPTTEAINMFPEHYLAEMAKGREHLKQEAIAHLLGLDLKDIHDAYMQAIELKQKQMKNRA